jgi:hypothetical protein
MRHKGVNMMSPIVRINRFETCPPEEATDTLLALSESRTDKGKAWV